MILGSDFIEERLYSDLLEEERLFAVNLNSPRKALLAMAKTPSPAGPVAPVSKSKKSMWFRKKNPSPYTPVDSKFDKSMNNKYKKPSSSSYDDGYNIFDRPERMEYNPNNRWFRKKGSI